MAQGQQAIILMLKSTNVNDPNTAEELFKECFTRAERCNAVNGGSPIKLVDEDNQSPVRKIEV